MFPHAVRWPDPAVKAYVRELQAEVKDQGLWAIFLDKDLGGPGFGQLKLGLLNEVIGRYSGAPQMFGASAPDTGNMEILAAYGTEEQKKRWLEPLLNQDMFSAYSMRQRRRVGLLGIVIGDGRGQLCEPDADGRAEPRGHQLGMRLLGLVQGRADDPVAAACGRRLDPLGPAASQQFLPHPVGPPLGPADAGGQPLGELAGVLGAALPEPQMAADLCPVVLERAARPFVKAEVGRGHTDLAGDECHRIVV